MSEPDTLAAVRAAASKAIEKAGGVTVTASRFSIQPSAVSMWKAAGIPPRRLSVMSAASGMSAHELRPDLWPAAEQAA